MRASHQEKSQPAPHGYHADTHSGKGSRWKLPDLPIGERESSKKNEPEWNFNGLAARMESVAISLWSWLIVGILSAWFAIWLAETLNRLGTRIP